MRPSHQPPTQPPPVKELELLMDFKRAGLDKTCLHLYKAPDPGFEGDEAEDHVPIEEATAVFQSEIL